MTTTRWSNSAPRAPTSPSAPTRVARAPTRSCCRRPARWAAARPLEADVELLEAGGSVRRCEERRLMPRNAMPFAFDDSHLLSDDRTKRRVAINQVLLRRVNDAMR